MAHRTRWTLRCRDLLSRESFVITQVDQATSGILLQITGSKAVLMTVVDATRLQEQIAGAIAVAATRNGASGA